MRRCSKCEREKSEAEFYRDSHGNIRNQCKSCCVAAAKKCLTRKSAGPTRAEVAQLLDYSPTTGVLKWRIARGKMRAGELAGSVNKSGYRVVFVGRKGYKAHRIAWLLVHGVWPTYTINHINGLKDDNRASNLEDIPLGENTKHAFRIGLKNIDHLTRYWAQRQMDKE